MTHNLESGLRSDLRRYKKALLKIGDGVNYEITGSVREGYRLWMSRRGPYGFVPELVNSFSTLDELLIHVESV